MVFHGYVAHNPGDTLVPYTYEPEPLGAEDVEVAISHCGICHSDVHIIDGDWGHHHPAVAGHEVVGTVAALGSNVKSLQIGQRVGIGWQSGSCMECEWCIRGETNLCPNSLATCKDRPGGFADRIRVDARFAFPIPDALDSVNAAPLLCGGITVYAPLAHFGVRPSDRVGVIGIGGLGHLAVQFAAKMGCEVTAFSTSPSKEAEARTLGAHHFINSKDDAQMKAARRSLDFIISTVNVNLDWDSYIKVLRPDGMLCFVGALSDPIQISTGLLLGNRRSVSGSPIGSRAQMQEMLDFAARHQVVAQTELLPMAEINTALDKVRRNEARYRMVVSV